MPTILSAVYMKPEITMATKPTKGTKIGRSQKTEVRSQRIFKRNKKIFSSFFETFVNFVTSVVKSFLTGESTLTRKRH